MAELRLSETFGPTIQGEGPSAGRQAWFVRLGRCNLDCAWCDTPYTWDWEGRNGVKFDPADLYVQDTASLAAQLKDAPLVVITGGEPLLQRKGVDDLCMKLRHVEIETNGTRPFIAPRRGVSYNVSPKLLHSGVDPEKAIVPAVLHDAAEREDCSFKFVAVTPDDVTEAARLVRQFRIRPERVWIMPEGRDGDTIEMRLGTLADATISEGFNLSPRLQVTAWGDERGR